MKQTNEMMSEKVEKDILYSRTVKAGKRVYYIDVKRDRRGALYLSITESKRVKDGNTEERPVFEKHKIFLYSEDVVKFMTALNAATDFTLDHYSASQGKNFSGQQWEKTEDAFPTQKEMREFCIKPKRILRHRIISSIK